ncbi:hypothetical protein P3T76_001215 [Phytophthora citrophthora]|uniref:BTB domain-containing protein n=1 Tax=Phytophthora citrophthora TaxID=4793 RepID=A0AAD9GZH0_9STRA|nr:hypothetical protein P3T76_001215 [Phytophthora citrophthora]
MLTHDELLLSVAGRYSIWVDRLQALTDELDKRRDFLPMPDPAFTIPELQSRLTELCAIAPCEPVKSLSSGFYPKRTEILIEILRNTIGESIEVKTVLFNHAIKEKGWNFVATPAQVEWKLRRVGGSLLLQASDQQASHNQKIPGDAATTPRKRQKAAEKPVQESDLSFVDNCYDIDSDFEVDSGDTTPEGNSPSDSRVSEGEATVAQRKILDNEPDNVEQDIELVDPVPDEAMALDGEAAMAAHLRSLINNKLMSDVTFVVEVTEVFAHKCIIIRSAYFRSLLSGKVKVSNVSREVFLILLEYVYTGCVNVSGNGVAELFVVAHCCGIECLKRQCSEKLQDSMCVDNAGEILSIAIKHNDPVLREKCFSYMLRNLEMVSKSRSFHELANNYPEVVVQIVQKLSSLVNIS